MVKKNPDRFERDVKPYIQLAKGLNAAVHPVDAAKLLRQYHQEVVELVKNEKVSDETGTEGDTAYNQAIDDILAKLEELSK